MQLQVFQTANQVGEAAAVLFAAQLLQKPDSVLGLATGSTPLPTYRQLTAYHQQGLLDFSRAQSFNLDEYCGIAPGHPQSYHAFMQEHLFAGINLPEDRRHIPSGAFPMEDTAAWQAECARYDRAIEAAGGVDLQLLGIGGNGHIGFNEPGDAFIGGTHVVQLDARTIEDNSRFFESRDQVPTHAITMGIRTILSAKHILLIATGAGKADILRDLLGSEITPRLPASILKTHPCVSLFADQEAASKLN